MKHLLLKADARRIPLADQSINCVVTSPPYYGLRDYGEDRQIGLEPTPGEFVDAMLGVFRDVRRVLRDDGTLWLNIGDSYCSTDKWGGGGGNTGKQTIDKDGGVPSWAVRKRKPPMDGIKPKDLVGIPWLLAFALRADGWYLRSEIIWHKPNPMPESVTDRPTKAHEQIFLLSKSERYWYDADAIKEAQSQSGLERARYPRVGHSKDVYGDGFTNLRNPATDKESRERELDGNGRNARSVWSIATVPFPGSHFATFPPEIPERCIKAGCPAGGVVLDPFNGSGTTGVVATGLGRRYVGLDINPDYLAMSDKRISRPHARIKSDRPSEPLPLFA